jgi:hypothetical protein
MQRNFEEEREQARQVAVRLTQMLQAHGYDVGPIDWESCGRLAYVSVNGIEAGDIITLGGAGERGRLLEDVRYKVLEATAQHLLQDNAPAQSWTPLELPADAPAEVQSLWRIHLGEDDRSGVNIAEVMRGEKRSYEYYPGGPTPGVHTFYVDKITPRALHLIREARGTIRYKAEAQRADDERGRRQVNLPEGTIQESESEAPMAPQRFTLPGGAVLRLEPQWYTVELYATDERVKTQGDEVQ